MKTWDVWLCSLYFCTFIFVYEDGDPLLKRISWCFRGCPYLCTCGCCHGSGGEAPCVGGVPLGHPTRAWHFIRRWLLLPCFPSNKSACKVGAPCLQRCIILKKHVTQAVFDYGWLGCFSFVILHFHPHQVLRTVICSLLLYSIMIALLFKLYGCSMSWLDNNDYDVMCCWTFRALSKSPIRLNSVLMLI